MSGLGGQSAEAVQSAVVHLDAETLAPIGISTPCPSTAMAHLGFQGLNGVRVPCGNLAGHDGPHIFHVEWVDGPSDQPPWRKGVDPGQITPPGAST